MLNTQPSHARTLFTLPPGFPSGVVITNPWKEWGSNGKPIFLPWAQLNESALRPNPDIAPQERASKPPNDLDYSRELDIHVWSQHPEVNAFVDAVYSEHFSGGKAGIKKKHLKVVLLDLYVAWCHDPDLRIRYSRNESDYRAGSRYNALHISKLTIKVVDRLIEAGLVEHKKGFKDRDSDIGRKSRMWPTLTLIQMFREALATLSPYDIHEHEEQETIVLRDLAGNDMEYENTAKTRNMRDTVRKYNALLQRTHISIPDLAEPFIELEDGSRIAITPTDTFVRRIFNRGNLHFVKGGRFYGGWWWRCPKEWRKKIHINEQPTAEIDFSAHHIRLLYANKDINYHGDPYELTFQPAFLEPGEQTRGVVKSLMLMAINAKDEVSAFRAFRDDAKAGSMEKTLSNDDLQTVLDQLKWLHSKIAHAFCSDAGVDMQCLDSQITAKLIDILTNEEIPILTIFDSYIVAQQHAEALQMTMDRVFEEGRSEIQEQIHEELRRSARALRDLEWRNRHNEKNGLPLVGNQPRIDDIPAWEIKHNIKSAPTDPILV